MNEWGSCAAKTISRVAGSQIPLCRVCCSYQCGSNDPVGTWFTENVCIDAGARGAGYLKPDVMVRIVPDIR